MNLVEELKLSPIPKIKEVLEAAIAAVSVRGEQHGDTEASFMMIAQLWQSYISHVMVIRGHLQLDASDVAQMMVMLKIARATYGKGIDNYVDAAGYTAIAAAIHGEPKDV